MSKAAQKTRFSLTDPKTALFVIFDPPPPPQKKKKNSLRHPHVFFRRAAWAGDNALSTSDRSF